MSNADEANEGPHIDQAGRVQIPVNTSKLPYTIGVDAWEVGWAFVGCTEDPATRVKQREILQRFLDELGSATWRWHLPPEIRHVHANHEIESVGLVDFGRAYGLTTGCQWCVYGVVAGETPPPAFYVEEGTRIPRYDLND